METLKDTQNLQIKFANFEHPFSIATFDGTSGTLSSPIDRLGIIEGTILLKGNVVVWNGLITITNRILFDLCVTPQNADIDEVIKWKELPPFFSLFDGGYKALSYEQINSLLDDLISFENLVQVKCHFKLENNFTSIQGRWNSQENLKSLSEIFIQTVEKNDFKLNDVILLEIEIFETVYFTIGIFEESLDDGIILSLTAHFYQQRNRAGRRTPISPNIIDGYKILEISDFGMKVSTPLSNLPKEPTLTLTINNYRLKCSIIYQNNQSIEETCIGLHIEDYSNEARKAWQSFLLSYQYPLLSYRRPEDHDKTWSLLERSGYFQDTVGTMVKGAQEDVLAEWTYSDNSGPDVGLTVVGVDENTKEHIATIGIARASHSAWVAQVAAVIDSPKYLNFTKSMYSWRTRAILQQIDGNYHLAFFDADKPFLDRFFRKFFLTRDSTEKELITWSEWYAHYLLPTFDVSLCKRGELGTKIVENRFVNIIAKGENVTVSETPYGHIVNARKHLHLAQLFASVWNETDAFNSYLLNISKHLELGHRFVLVMNAKDFDPNLEDLKSAVKYTKKVVWTCARPLLPDFLANSLRALEIMIKKYGNKRVA